MLLGYEVGLLSYEVAPLGYEVGLTLLGYEVGLLCYEVAPLGYEVVRPRVGQPVIRRSVGLLSYEVCRLSYEVGLHAFYSGPEVYNDVSRSPFAIPTEAESDMRILVHSSRSRSHNVPRSVMWGRGGSNYSGCASAFTNFVNDTRCAFGELRYQLSDGVSE